MWNVFRPRHAPPVPPTFTLPQHPPAYLAFKIANIATQQDVSHAFLVTSFLTTQHSPLPRSARTAQQPITHNVLSVIKQNACNAHLVPL